MLFTYCKFTKIQTFSLAFGASSQPPNCFKQFHSSKFQSLLVGCSPQQLNCPMALNCRNFSNFFGQIHLENFGLPRLVNHSIGTYFKTLGKKNLAENYLNGFYLENALRSYPLTRAKCFFSSNTQQAVDGNDDLVSAGKTLPWLATKIAEETGRLGKVTAAKTNQSSWEVSAEKFLKGGASTVENREIGRGHHRQNKNTGEVENFEEGEEEEEGAMEEIIDPRWNTIKNKLNRFSEFKPRYNRPEVRQWDKQESWGRKTYKEATESTIPKMVGEGIYGVGPVLAALSAVRREFYALYIQEGLDLSNNNRKKKDKKGFEKVLKIAERIGVSKKVISKHDLNMIVDNRPHQGLVLDASPLEMVGIKELDPVMDEGVGGPLWVALDEVTDPQNLGAIIRSAYFFGASGMVLCAKNSAPLSGIVSKASAGSLEVMELRSCKNMMQFLASSARNGWRVLGGSVSSRSVPLKEVSPGAPTILVLGSEGTGLRPLVERSCTQLIRIPGNIPIDIIGGDDEEVKTAQIEKACSGQEFQSFLAVESLNVSVAAGVLLHHLIGCNYSDQQYQEKQTSAI